MPAEIYQCVVCGYRELRWPGRRRICPHCGAPMLSGAEIDQEDRDAAQDAD